MATEKRQKGNEWNYGFAKINAFPCGEKKVRLKKTSFLGRLVHSVANTKGKKNHSTQKLSSLL